MENNNYIEKLLEKLSIMEDEELKKMILRLIEERNYLKTFANIDPLSGLNNRRLLEKIRNYEFVSMIDVDNFKTINDKYGHSIGDNVIRIISSILKNNSRSEDYIIRYGGDEFLMIFTGGTYKTITDGMNKIRKEVSEKIRIPNYNVTLSIGIVPYDVNLSLEDTIKKADELMYNSKKEGKNHIYTLKNNNCQ